MIPLQVIEHREDAAILASRKWGHYKVNEIFYSIQGEGVYAGTPMVFVRFAKCNLRCSWCDTEFDAFQEMSAEDIVRRVAELAEDCQHICFTGGEPTLQLDEELVQRFPRSVGLHIETNGMFPIAKVEDFCNITISPKMPLSRLRDMHSAWLRELVTKRRVWVGGSLSLKVVFDMSPSFAFEEIINSWGRLLQWDYRFLQPLCLDGTDNRAAVADFCMKNPAWRVSLQTHKLLGLP